MITALITALTAALLILAGLLLTGLAARAWQRHRARRRLLARARAWLAAQDHRRNPHRTERQA